PAILIFLITISAESIITQHTEESRSRVQYCLRTEERREGKDNEAALKYVIYGGVASGVMLYGMSILYGLFATTCVTGAGGIGDQLANVTSQLFRAHAFGGQPAAQLSLAVAGVFVLAGVGSNGASVPLHMWCP